MDIHIRTCLLRPCVPVRMSGTMPLLDAMLMSRLAGPEDTTDIEVNDISNKGGPPRISWHVQAGLNSAPLERFGYGALRWVERATGAD